MIAAIVPAAGRSERMGRPKLILPIGRTTVIATVVTALKDGGAEPVVVVTPPADFAGAAILADEARAAGACVLIPARHPIDMRASVELGLDHLGQGPGAPPATFLIVPGDSPGLTANLVREVIARSRQFPNAIVIPVYEGKRGHPIALPWSFAAKLRALPPGVGVNALVALHLEKAAQFEVADPGAVADLDTPEDYRRLSGGPT